jgi:hypothetical protein
MDLKQWLALADSDQPLPAEVREAAQVIRGFALARRLPPDRAAVEMAKAVGLTAGAIEAFRTEQDALLATMMIEFNRSQPTHKQVQLMEEDLAARYGVTSRTIRRWRKRVMKEDT